MNLELKLRIGIIIIGIILIVMLLLNASWLRQDSNRECKLYCKAVCPCWLKEWDKKTSAEISNLSQLNLSTLSGNDANNS